MEILDFRIYPSRESANLDRGKRGSNDRQWVTLDGKPPRIDITPEAVGELVVNLQAKAPSGETSDQQELSVTVTAPSQIAAEATCEAKIINLDYGAKIPVQLRIDGKVRMENSW